jgi:hypothetical protein
MTDYLLAANLQMAYDAQQQAQQQAAYQAPPPQAFTPEQMAVMKQMVANEVKQQLQADQAAAAQPAPVPSAAPVQPTAEAAPPALDPNQRTFIVAASVDATVDGGPCTLSGGDILYRSGDLGNDGKVGVTILNSKAGDCAANHTTAVELAALQDMHNQFRQQLASGMDTLASKQGQGGMPTSPPAGAVQLADGQATAAPDAQTLLAQINQQADQTETEIKQAAVGAPVGLLQPGNSRACTPARACD